MNSKFKKGKPNGGVGAQLIGFDKKVLFYIAAIILLPLLLKTVGLVLAFIIMIARCVRGDANDVIESVILATALRFLNPFILEGGLTVAVGSVLVHCVGLFVVFRNVRAGMMSRGSNVLWVSLIIYLAISSLCFSRYPDVSLFKLTMFSVVFLLLAQGIRISNIRRLEIFLYNFFLFSVVASAPLLAVPAIGMGRNAQGFQGIFNHPQAFGPILTLFLGYFMSLSIFAKDQFKWHKITLILILVALFFLYKTQARTGMFALILTLVTTTVVVMSDLRFPTKRKFQLSKYALIGICAGGLLSLFAMNEIQHFVFKSRGADVADVSAEAVYSSREGVVSNALYSLNTHPVFGIGFGVASPYTYMKVTYLPGTRIPISAPIEKGLMLVAMLEEGGVVGLIIILAVFYFIFLERRKVNSLYVCTLLVVFFVNFGESLLFTSNGLGPLMMVFVFLQPQKSSWGKLV